jgi:RNA polymerase sigma-70 factor (ECF subfamily)
VRSRGSECDPLAAIVAGCQRHDRDAQRQLYEACAEGVFRLVNRMVGSQDAPDLVQEVFLKVFSSVDQFVGNACFETWLYRVTTNECLQFLRRAKRRACGPLVFEPRDREPGNAAQAAHKELLTKALDGLEPELRCLFLLREAEGLSYEKIAAALAIPEGTVGSRLNRARAELKQRLLELGWEF